MTVLILSDTHGMRHRIEKLLSLHPRTDAMLFLGDGAADFSEEMIFTPSRLFGGVCGNCDIFTFQTSQYSFQNELLLQLDAYTVMMMHGHTHSVKSGADAAIRHAALHGADVLLYGHTHIPEERYLPEGSVVGGVTLQKPMYVFNPGSLGKPIDGIPRFGLMEIRNGQILFSHGSL